MSEKKDIKTEKPPNLESAKPMKSKLLLIGIPVFIVQLVVVYFITANLLVPKDNSTNESADLKDEVTEEQTETSKGAEEFLFNLEDIIVNPSETNGKVLLLVKLGLGVGSAEAQKSLEEKQVVIKDVVINILSSKTVPQLSRSDYRDSLKVVILKDANAKLPGINIKNIYFSKFLIQ